MSQNGHRSKSSAGQGVKARPAKIETPPLSVERVTFILFGTTPTSNDLTPPWSTKFLYSIELTGANLPGRRPAPLFGAGRRASVLDAADAPRQNKNNCT